MASELWRRSPAWRWLVAAASASLVLVLLAQPWGQTGGYTPAPPSFGPSAAPAGTTPSTTPLPQPAVIDRCKLQGTMPAKFQVHAVGTYRGGGTAARQLTSKGTTKGTKVLIGRTQEPLLLVLTAYDPVLWEVELHDGARLAGIFLSGYHQQEVEGVPDAIVKFRSNSEDSSQGCQQYFYAFSQGADLDRLNAFVHQISGQSIGSFDPQKSPRQVVVGDDVPRAALEARDPAQPIVRAAPPSPEGDAGINYLLSTGAIRRATSSEVAKLPGGGESRRLFGGAYVVLKAITVPGGLAGANAVTFIVPKGVPEPEGYRGHSRFYYPDSQSCEMGSIRLAC